MNLTTCRVELKEANEFISKTHRHHKPVVGHRFSVGAMFRGQMVGVAVVGRPVARNCDQKYTAEVTRLATDGTRNACSFLYAKSAQIAELLGFYKIQTYILEGELGTSLLAAGWVKVAESPGGYWKRSEGTARRTDQPMCGKSRWEKVLRHVIPMREVV